MSFLDLLRDAASVGADTSHAPLLLDPQNEADGATLETLLGSNEVRVIDSLPSQLDELVRGRSPRQDLPNLEVEGRIRELLAGTAMESFGAWVYYPWVKRLVHVLPRDLHRELRLDRNRYKISVPEQERLLGLRIGVAGLSVGRSIVTTLVREGVGGHIRLADFDTMSLSNLNRVEGSLADIGLNKAILAARQVAELDPYIEVQLYTAGVTLDTLDAFTGGLDVLVDECDDLSMKVLLRERARAARLPVVMATSDRGMLDIERFDLEPERALFHGLLDGIGYEKLAGLPTKEKVPHVLRVLDAGRLQARMAASLVEVKETISTWPQLASGVVLGGAMVTSAIRRIALDELRCSGRFEVDLEELLVKENALEVRVEPLPSLDGALGGALPRGPERPAAGIGPSASRDELRFIVACATLAPSGGNAQPWRFEAGPRGVRCFLDPRPSFLDFELRASALAAGAALENAVIAARALGFQPNVTIEGGADHVWDLALERTGASGPDDGRELDLVRSRSSNRTTKESGPLADEKLRAIADAAGSLVVRFVTGTEPLARFADTIADADRLQFLSAKTHAEIFAEIRWTPEEARAKRDGLDVASLELDASDLAVLDVLRSRPAMLALRDLGLGRALGNPARTAFRRSGAAAVIASAASDRSSLVVAGRDLERMWLAATANEVAVHPWGSPFLFQRLKDARETFDAWEQSVLDDVSRSFSEQLGLEPGVTPLLVLRLSNAGSPKAVSLRRDLDAVLRFV
jgi:molybdopterin/thiamine biosynthesis adenylyltransferase